MKKILIVAICLIMQVRSVIAQSLVINGKFNNGIVAWSIYNDANRSIKWVSNDGKDAVGSIEVSSLINNGGALHSYSEKIPVVPNDSYHFKAYAKPISSTNASAATIWLALYDENLIYFGDANFITVATNVANDEWYLLEKQIIIPANIKYIDVHLGVEGTLDQTPTESLARFDDVELIPHGIFKNNFE